MSPGMSGAESTSTPNSYRAQSRHSRAQAAQYGARALALGLWRDPAPTPLAAWVLLRLPASKVCSALAAGDLCQWRSTCTGGRGTRASWACDGSAEASSGRRGARLASSKRRTRCSRRSGPAWSEPSSTYPRVGVSRDAHTSGRAPAPDRDANGDEPPVERICTEPSDDEPASAPRRRRHVRELVRLSCHHRHCNPRGRGSSPLVTRSGQVLDALLAAVTDTGSGQRVVTRWPPCHWLSRAAHEARSKGREFAGNHGDPLTERHGATRGRSEFDSHPGHHEGAWRTSEARSPRSARFRTTRPRSARACGTGGRVTRRASQSGDAGFARSH